VIVSCSRGFSETLPLETSGAADSKKKKGFLSWQDLFFAAVFSSCRWQKVFCLPCTLSCLQFFGFFFLHFFAYNASGKSSKIDILFAFFPFFLKNIAYKRKTFASHLVQMEPVKGNVSTNRNNPC